MKCIIDPASTEPCKRCAKAGRACVVTPPTRKRQKKADGRVAELERKIDALTAKLAQGGNAGPHYENGYTPDVKRSAADSASPYAQTSPQYQADQRLLGNHDPNGSPTMARQVVNTQPSEGPNKRRRMDKIATNRTVRAYLIMLFGQLLRTDRLPKNICEVLQTASETAFTIRKSLSKSITLISAE